jgi:predicted Holliday junction resolvase-like endonuclease
VCRRSRVLESILSCRCSSTQRSSFRACTTIDNTCPHISLHLTKQEKVDEIRKEKERRERGQKIDETLEERQRLQRKRDNEKLKKEKEVRLTGC